MSSKSKKIIKYDMPRIVYYGKSVSSGAEQHAYMIARNDNKLHEILIKKYSKSGAHWEYVPVFPKNVVIYQWIGASGSHMCSIEQNQEKLLTADESFAIFHRCCCELTPQEIKTVIKISKYYKQEIDALKHRCHELEHKLTEEAYKNLPDKYKNTYKI